VTYPAQPAFSQPSAGGGGGDSFEPKDHFGNLLLVFPKSYVAEFSTKNGVTPKADVDIIVVDKPGPDGKPTALLGAAFFGNLANSVRNDIGGQVLGRLGQGPNTRGTPPWILANFTPEDAAMATPALAAYQAGQFKQAAPNPMASPQGTPAGYAQTPQTPASPPAQQQWQQQATPAPQAAPAYAQQAPPTAQPQQQWQQPAAPQAGPPAQTAPQAPAASGADPALLARLAQFGINLPPTTPQAQAEAIAATLPQ
jgi:hypothetical protein